MAEEELEFLYRVTRSIQPYLEDFTLVGGLASLLYSFHENAEPVGSSPLFTYDVDLVSEENVPLRGKTSVHHSLTEANLEYKVKGSYLGYAVKYYPKEDENSPYYVEFHCPLMGAVYNREGEANITQKVQEDLIAQRLRYLDLLLHSPWQVHTSSIPALRKYPNLTIKIPHPCMYIMQKILIIDDRRKEDRNKDCAYIYQTLFYFRRDIKSLASEYENVISLPLWEKWYSRFIHLSTETFDSPDKDGPIEASKILDNVTPQMVSAAVMSFIDTCPKIQ
jgi:hypothetical protein